MLDDIKVLLGISLEDTSKDALLNILIRKSEGQFNSYCKTDEVPEKANDVIVDLTIVHYNRLGSEGKQSETVGSLADHFYSSSDVPESIRQRMNTFRRMR